MSTAWLRRSQPRQRIAAAAADRRGRGGAIAGALCGALLGLLLWAPAAWLAGQLAEASGDRVLLAEADGTVWNGSAALVLTGGPGSSDAAALPGRLQWTLRPTWSGLALRIRQSCCLSAELALRLTPGWRGLTLQWLEPAGATATADGTTIGQWPLAVLAGLGTPWNTLQLGGTLRLASAGVQLQWTQGQARLQGGLLLELDQVRSRVSSLPVLGSYRLGLRGSDLSDGASTLRLDTLSGALRLDTLSGALRLDTVSGALRLSGSGQWNAAGLRFRGQASAAPGDEAALANLLNIIGRRQGALSTISIG